MLYSASLLFRSVHSTGESALWEDSIVLINAESEEIARLKARQFGKAREVSYVVDADDTISVVFQCVERVYLVTDFIEVAGVKDLVGADGVEVFSRFLREEEALSLMMPFDASPIEKTV